MSDGTTEGETRAQVGGPVGFDHRCKDRRKQRDCPHPSVDYYVIVCANGARQLRLMCDECHVDDGKNLPHWRALGGLDTIKVIADLRTPEHPCERCGESATEFHHWAPKHLFPDYDRWPTSYLCIACHLHWHQQIVKHYGKAA